MTNTSANPAITQGVPTLAAQIVDLTTLFDAPPAGGVYVPFQSVSPIAEYFSNYSVPANQSLVIAAVDITPSPITSSSQCTAGTTVFLTVNESTRKTLTATGLNTNHFVYPSGIVLAPGTTPAIINVQVSACDATVDLHGYLTSN